MGYGWLQMAINDDFTTLTFFIIIALILAKIVATSLTIGSGGSGGVFAPALFIGGMIGAGLWMACGTIIPNFALTSAPFVIVGMMAFFGAAGKAPIAVILMVAEMTGSYALLVPAMIATAIAYIISGKSTIYHSQLPSKTDSPAHKGEYTMEVLRGIKVRQAMIGDVVTVIVGSTVFEAGQKMEESGIKSIPVVDNTNSVVGMITLDAVKKVPYDKRSRLKVSDVMTKEVVFTYQDESLASAMQKMFKHKINSMPVFESKDRRIPVGTISREDFGNAYCISMEELLIE